MNLNLQGANGLKEMLTQVEIYANGLEPGKWVIGRGWIEKKWPEGRFPTIQELDMISPDKPMALERADGHAIIGLENELIDLILILLFFYQSIPSP